MNNQTSKLQDVILFVMKMFYYAVAAIIMFRILQADWFVFMLICIIIFMCFPDYFKD